jgi:hypothetical protein
MSTLAELTACYLLNDYLPKTIIEPYLLFQDFSIVLQQNLFREYTLGERFFWDPIEFQFCYVPFFDISELVEQLPRCDCEWSQYHHTTTFCFCVHQKYYDTELGRYISDAVISLLDQYESQEIENNGEDYVLESVALKSAVHYSYLSIKQVLLSQCRQPGKKKIQERYEGEDIICIIPQKEM